MKALPVSGTNHIVTEKSWNMMMSRNPVTVALASDRSPVVSVTEGKIQDLPSAKVSERITHCYTRFFLLNRQNSVVSLTLELVLRESPSVRVYLQIKLHVCKWPFIAFMKLSVHE